jgi:hypothetical protein
LAGEFSSACSIVLIPARFAKRFISLNIDTIRRFAPLGFDYYAQAGLRQCALGSQMTRGLSDFRVPILSIVCEPCGRRERDVKRLVAL